MTNHDERRFAEEQQRTLSRRRFLEGTLSAALASAGIYAIIDTLVQAPVRDVFAASQPLTPEQYAIPTPRLIMENGSGVKSSTGTFPVLVPPLHNHVITATLKVPANAQALQEAQHHLESVLLGLEQRFPPPPSGLGIVTAWGLPYFQHYIPSLGKSSSFFRAGTRYPAYLPVDLMTSKQRGQTVYAIQESMTFPSDQPPPGFGPVRLEQNEVAVLLRSDSLANIMAGTNTLFGTGSNQAGSLFKVTSIRRGFTGGGEDGQEGLARKLALAANIPGANSIPPHAPIFLGFTSTVQSGESPTPVESLETLPGWTDQWPNGYFKYGTTMALSHLFDDLAAWYGSGGGKPQNFSTFADRARAMFRPGLSVAEGTITANPPIESEANVFQDVQKYQ